MSVLGFCTILSPSCGVLLRGYVLDCAIACIFIALVAHGFIMKRMCVYGWIFYQNVQLCFAFCILLLIYVDVYLCREKGLFIKWRVEHAINLIGVQHEGGWYSQSTWTIKCFDPLVTRFDENYITNYNNIVPQILYFEKWKNILLVSTKCIFEGYYIIFVK